MAPTVPGLCTQCGAFSSGEGGIYAENTSLTIHNSTLYGCERCGGPVQLLEGSFEVREGIIEMLQGPQWSWDLVADLRRTVQRALDEDAEDPADIVATADSGVAAVLREAAKNLPRPRKRDLLWLIFTALTVDYETVGGNADAVRDAILRILMYVVENGRLPTIL